MEKGKRGYTNKNKTSRSRNLQEFLEVMNYFNDIRKFNAEHFDKKDLENYYNTIGRQDQSFETYRDAFSTNYKRYGNKKKNGKRRWKVRYGVFQKRGYFKELGNPYYHIEKLNEDHLNLRVHFNPQSNKHEVQKFDLLNNLPVGDPIKEFKTYGSASQYIRDIYKKEGTLKTRKRGSNHQKRPDQNILDFYARCTDA